MQIYALDSENKLIHASHALREIKYQCPECKKELRIRGGYLRQLHFYHLEPSNCHHLAKSATHLHIQHALQKMLGEHAVLLEQRFPEIGRIADVVWPEKKLIFECQVSPISANEVRERNRDYQKLGFTVIWILHDRRYNRSHQTQAEAFLRTSPHYFTNMNALGKGTFYDQYASFQHRLRTRQSERLIVSFKEFTSLNLKQFPRQFPEERKKWAISFEGDLYHRGFQFKKRKRDFFKFLRWLGHFYKIIFRILLENSTH